MHVYQKKLGRKGALSDFLVISAAEKRAGGAECRRRIALLVQAPFVPKAL